MSALFLIDIYPVNVLLYMFVFFFCKLVEQLTTPTESERGQ